MSIRLVAAAAIVALGATAARAHVTLETREAPADSYYKAAFNVGHGCKGSPTVRVRVRIPDGVVAVKPQPKAGWELAITKGQLATPYSDGHGGTISEGVTEVTWSGGKLLDEHFDQFILRVKLPNKPNSFVYFPVVQECEQGAHRWIEIPAEGKTLGDYKEPAAALKLTPKQ